MSADRFERLLAHLGSVPPGPDKVQALCDLADLLEADGQLERVFDFKLQIAHLAEQAGLYDQAIAAFAWCRERKREHPRRFTGDILPTFERLVHSLIGKVRWRRLEQLLDELQQSTEESGSSLYRVYWQRQVVAWFRGDEAKADEFADRMRGECPPLGNCQLCDLNFEIRRIAERGDHHRALQLARPILRGDRSCSSVPRSMYHALLYPLLALGRKEEAERCYQKGYTRLRSLRKHSAEFGAYLRYLALLDALDEAAKLIERHMGPPEAFSIESDAFAFYEGAWIACAKLRRRGDAQLAIRLERRLGVPRSSAGRVALDELTAYLRRELTRIAAQYDSLNETDRFSRLLSRAERLSEERFGPRLKVDFRR